jgi:hypothetical protein
MADILTESSPVLLSPQTFSGMAKELLDYESHDPAKLLATVQSMNQMIQSMHRLDLSTVEPAVVFCVGPPEDDQYRLPDD